MKVAALMTSEPFTIRPEERLDEAIALMDRLEVRHLPVTRDGAIVGLLSERDLLEATGWLPDAGRPDDRQRVRDVMTADPITVDPDAEVVSVVVELMTDGIGCLPVVEEGWLVGILTEIDVMRALLGTLRDSDAGPDVDPSVSTLMTRNVVSIGPGSSQEEARALCAQRNVRHLPIVDGERFVGVVSDRDLRRARGRHQESEPVVAIAMRRPPLFVAPAVSVSTALEQLLQAKVSSLPVIGEHDELVGILTTTDLLDHGMNTLWQVE